MVEDEKVHKEATGDRRPCSTMVTEGHTGQWSQKATRGNGHRRPRRAMPLVKIPEDGRVHTELGKEIV